MTAILAMLAAIAAYALLRPVDRPPEVIVGPVAPDTLVGPTAPEIPGFAFTPLATPSPAPEVRFWEGGWSPLGLADFRGKVVLLNFWATWCPPCRREMPTLDRLQAELGGPDFEVVALSVDRGGGPQVEAFFEQLNLTNLKLYVDPTMRSVQAFRVVGLPTTVLLDRRGYELGRVVGPAEWDSPAAIALVQGAIAEGSDPKEAEGGAAGPEASSPSPT
ncbi:MAG: TlpA family protein disulfide reductase, partial [Alphaproteobacteria bacterium]